MALLRTGMCPVMVGRADEARRLRALLAAAPESRVALVSGEAGVGKTRLIRELLADLPDGWRVLMAQAEQGLPGRPYELLAEAVEPYLDGDPPATVDPAALRVLVRPSAGDEVERPAEALLRAAVDLVRHVVGPGPAVCVFEDLQWADAQSLTLFRRLAGVSGLPLLLIGTYRTEGLDRALLTEVLDAVGRHRAVEHIDVARLDRAGVAELLAAVYGAPVRPEVTAALHERTGGNPFHLEELLASAGDAPPEALPGLSLPADVTEAVLRHLDGLDDQQREVVDAASVLGQRIPFDLLSAVTGLPERQLIAVLRALLGRGLVVEEDVDVFSFRHALTREAVAGRLLGRERRRLHERALSALQAAGSDDWSALARHAAGAGRSEEIVAIGRAGAAHYLRSGAVLEAVRLTELALEETDDDAELLELATRAAWSAALPERALDRGERWRKLAAVRGDDEMLGRSLRVLARIRWESGDAEAQRRIADEAREIGERLPPGPEKARLYAMLAEVQLLRGDAPGAIHWADTGLALPDDVVGTDARAALLANKGSALAGSGQFETARALLLESADLAERSGDGLTALRALNNLVVDGHRWQPVAQTYPLIDRMGAIVDRFGWYGRRLQVQGLRLIIQIDVEGDLEGAHAQLAALAPDELLPVNEAHNLVFALIYRALFAVETGDPDLAERLVSAPEAPQLEDRAWPTVERLHVELLIAGRRGRVEDLAERLDRLDRVVTEMIDNGQDEAWYRGLFFAASGGLDPDRLAAVRERHQPEDGGAAPAWEAHVDGIVAERSGDHRAAIAAYGRSLEEVLPTRCPAVVADVHSGLARCLLALDRPAEARSHAEQAGTLLARWPGWRRAEAETLLRRLGGGPAITGPDALTPREREVALLVAEGLSNAELGRRLYISPKTASVHVSNILAKLGMSSRVEIAAWAIRERLNS